MNHYLAMDIKNYTIGAPRQAFKQSINQCKAT
jgi:hypothetical protein